MVEVLQPRRVVRAGKEEEEEEERERAGEMELMIFTHMGNGPKEIAL